MRRASDHGEAFAADVTSPPLHEPGDAAVRVGHPRFGKSAVHDGVLDGLDGRA